MLYVYERKPVGKVGFLKLTRLRSISIPWGVGVCKLVFRREPGDVRSRRGGIRDDGSYRPIRISKISRRYRELVLFLALKLRSTMHSKYATLYQRSE